MNENENPGCREGFVGDAWGPCRRCGELLEDHPSDFENREGDPAWNGALNRW